VRWEDTYSVGSLRKSHPQSLMRTETDLLSQTLCFFYFLEYRTMNKVQNPSNSECYTPSSESFRNYSLTSLRPSCYWEELMHGMRICLPPRLLYVFMEWRFCTNRALLIIFLYAAVDTTRSALLYCKLRAIQCLLPALSTWPLICPQHHSSAVTIYIKHDFKAYIQDYCNIEPYKRD
jgi:hypothetical protein